VESLLTFDVRCASCLFLMNIKPSKYKLLFCSVAFSTLLGCGGGGGGADSTPTTSAPALPQLSATTTQLTGSVQNGVDQWADGSTATGGQGTTINGVNCLVTEDYHIHTQLTIIRDGQQLAIPAHVGLQGCAYETHTHDKSGVVHVETNVAKRFTLGQFFSVWGQPLTSTNIAGIPVSKLAIYIQDGTKLSAYTGDIGSIDLQAHRVIYLVIGTPPATLPNYQWDPGL
jgi:hypothetical protein